MKIRYSDDMDLMPVCETMKSKKPPRSFAEKQRAFRVSVRRVEGGAK